MTQRSAILTTEVDNGKSQGFWDTDGGNNTLDRIFLLSLAEINRYLGEADPFSSNMELCAVPTDYAIAQGAWTQTANGKQIQWWWLRPPGSVQNFATGVNNDGWISYSNVVIKSGGCVRPAFWLNLEADIF